MVNNFAVEVNLYVQKLGPQSSKELASLGHSEKARIVSEQTGRRGVAPGVHSAVDGRPTENYEGAQRVIVELFDYRVEIVFVAFQELRARSPVGPVEGGHYRDEHLCQLDGVGLPPLQAPTAAQVANVSRITLTNPVPYARKLEVGITKSGGSFVVQVAPHIYESVAKHLAREYRNVAKITFGFTDLANAPTVRGTFHSRTARGIVRRSRGSQTLRYPAIFIDRL